MYGFRINLILCILTTIILSGCEKNKGVDPETDVYTDITVIVEDEYHIPIAGAILTTYPPTQELITDGEGRAVFENILVKPYFFNVIRDNLPLYKIYIILDKDNLEDVHLVVISESPDMKIILPNPDDFVSAYNIRFIGEGMDPEDGILPDSSLVWYSNIDGELGHGKELTLERLTLGDHIIRFQGKDSDMKIGQDTITITVTDYHPSSYFPLPAGAQWIYWHKNNRFSMINNKDISETWELMNINVSFDETNKRTCRMSYKASVGDRARDYDYIVTDYIEKENGNIYVKKTTEQLNIWKYSSSEIPDEQLEIETNYTPSYLLLKNMMNPSTESSYENKIRTDITWYYKDPLQFNRTMTFDESFDVTISVNIGGRETIETELGEFEAITITITQDVSQRKWWLAKGLGIVRLQYNSFNPPQVADLSNTNLINYYDDNVLQKITIAHVPANPVYVGETTLSAEDDLKRLKQLRTMFRSFLPL